MFRAKNIEDAWAGHYRRVAPAFIQKFLSLHATMSVEDSSTFQLVGWTVNVFTDKKSIWLDAHKKKSQDKYRIEKRKGKDYLEVTHIDYSGRGSVEYFNIVPEENCTLLRYAQLGRFGDWLDLLCADYLKQSMPPEALEYVE